MLGALVAAGAVICAALWRLEFVSTWCAFAAVAGVVLVARVRRNPAPGGRYPGGPPPAARVLRPGGEPG